jgi:hypothetical protein
VPRCVVSIEWLLRDIFHLPLDRAQKGFENLKSAPN